MTTYEDNLLAARFAALAPEPLAGDWEEIRDRAARVPRKRRRRFGELLQSRRRRPLVVLAAVVLVIVLGAASALAVRAILGAKGIVGLAPVGATPSTPARGELVLSFMFGRTGGDHGRFLVSVYTDGRMIWQRTGDYSLPVTDEHRNSTGWLERRLTPEGVELVRAEVLSSGLVDHDLRLTSGEGLYFGSIDLRSGDRRVHVSWGDVVIFPGGSMDGAGKAPTRKQARALVRLDERLENPASWLPASAWEDPETKAFVPSGYTVCYQAGKGVGLSSLLQRLPSPAERLLRAQENTPQPYTNLLGTFPRWCSRLRNDEARALAQILDRAGVRGSKSEFGVEYGPSDIGATRAYADATEFDLGFSPLFPEQREP